METLVAEYYNEELADWTQITEYCIEEVLEFEQRLTDIIRRDSIPAIAASAEHFLQQFELLQQHFLALQHEVGLQETKLVQNNIPVGNKAVTPQVILDQSSLRKKMFQTEKAFLETKYGCYEFFSSLLHSQQ